MGRNSRTKAAGRISAVGADAHRPTHQMSTPLCKPSISSCYRTIRKYGLEGQNDKEPDSHPSKPMSILRAAKNKSISINKTRAPPMYSNFKFRTICARPSGLPPHITPLSWRIVHSEDHRRSDPKDQTKLSPQPKAAVPIDDQRSFNKSAYHLVNHLKPSISTFCSHLLQFSDHLPGLALSRAHHMMSVILHASVCLHHMSPHLPAIIQHLLRFLRFPKHKGINTITKEARYPEKQTQRRHKVFMGLPPEIPIPGINHVKSYD